MHFHKEFHILNDVISAIDYIFLIQLFTLCKNDISFIKRFMKISRLSFTKSKLKIYNLLLLLICSFKEQC